MVVCSRTVDTIVLSCVQADAHFCAALLKLGTHLLYNLAEHLFDPFLGFGIGFEEEHAFRAGPLLSLFTRYHSLLVNLQVGRGAAKKVVS